MPSLPDVPGRTLVEETMKRSRLRVIAIGVGAGIGAAAGFLLKRVLGDGDRAEAGPKKALKAAPKPKAGAAAKPPWTTGTDAPPKPEVEPGNISSGKDPHHVLNNPIDDPDETEYPDPFEKREDPLAPVDPGHMVFGGESHAPTGAHSTSEPHPGQDLEARDRAEPPKREKLDQ